MKGYLIVKLLGMINKMFYKKLTIINLKNILLNNKRV